MIVTTSSSADTGMLPLTTMAMIAAADQIAKKDLHPMR